MSKKQYSHKSGEWNAVCDICGFVYKSSELRRDHEGRMCCPKDWSPKHPQLDVHPVKREKSIPWSRPEAPDNFIERGEINTENL